MAGWGLAHATPQTAETQRWAAGGAPSLSTMRGAPLVLLVLQLLRPADACESWCNQWICKQEACLTCGEEAGCPAKPPPPPAPPPLPQLPPWHRGLPPGEINFAASGGVLWANGEQFFLKGVNWCARLPGSAAVSLSLHSLTARAPGITWAGLAAKAAKAPGRRSGWTSTRLRGTCGS